VADLTSVARVRNYAPLANTPSLTNELTTLVSVQSQAVLDYIATVVPFEAHVNAQLRGRGAQAIMLPRVPLLAVQSLTVLGQPVAQVADSRQAGFIADTDSGLIALTCGLRFPQDFGGVQCSWTAGYQGQQTTAIPVGTGNATTSTITPTENVAGGFASVVANVISTPGGVVFASAANQSNPMAGEYAFSDGTFTFNTADANTSVVMQYYYVPGPLMQACNETIATVLQQRQNVGIGGKTLAGETIRYDWTQFSDTIKSQLQPYRRMAPT
jgi:hypothetical protein